MVVRAGSGNVGCLRLLDTGQSSYDKPRMAALPTLIHISYKTKENKLYKGERNHTDCDYLLLSNKLMDI